MEKDEYHFITGLPRAGTTLLSSELNKYDNILVLPESKHVLKMLKNKNYQNELKKYYKNVQQKIKNTPYELDNKIDNVILESGNKSIQENSIAIGKCFSFFGNQKKPPIIIDKNPVYSFHFEEIIKAFPKAKFVITLRNPCSFVLSKTQKKNSNDKVQSPWHFAYVWNNFTSSIIKLKNKYPDKTLIMKYEDLVTDKDSFSNIATFFGAKNEASKTLSYGAEYEKLIENSNFSERLKTKYLDLSKPINTSRINAYENLFSPSKVQRIESICYHNMLELGYQPAFPKKTYIQNTPFNILGKLHNILAKKK